MRGAIPPASLHTAENAQHPLRGNRRNRATTGIRQQVALYPRLKNREGLRRPPGAYVKYTGPQRLATERYTFATLNCQATSIMGFSH